MTSKVKDSNSYYLLEDPIVRDTFQQCFDNTRDLQSQIDNISTSGSGGSYTLPSATTQTLGGVIVGSGLSVTSTGLLSVSTSIPTASTTVLGGIKVSNALGIDASTGVHSPIYAFADYYSGSPSSSHPTVTSSDLNQTVYIGTNTSTSTSYTTGLHAPNFTFMASRHGNLTAPAGKYCVVRIDGNGTYSAELQLVNNGNGLAIEGTSFGSFIRVLVPDSSNNPSLATNSGFDLFSYETRARQKFRPADDSSTTATTKYLGDAAGYQQSTYTRYFSVGHIHTLNCHTVNSVSDQKMKQDIADSSLGLDFILSLQPKQFRYRNDPDAESTDENLSYGFIAQDIKTLIDNGLNWQGWNDGIVKNSNPNWEADEESEYYETTQTIDYEMFIAPLVKAMQEQQIKINALTARVSELESQLSSP